MPTELPPLVGEILPTFADRGCCVVSATDSTVVNLDFLDRSGDIAPLFLTSALDGGEWSASRPCRFIPRGKSPRYPLDRRLGGPQGRSRRCGEIIQLALPGIEPEPSSPSLYRLSYPDSPIRHLTFKFETYIFPPFYWMRQSPYAESIVPAPDDIWSVGGMIVGRGT
jgi:hypothetical protein